jgi:hypothetical protein
VGGRCQPGRNLEETRRSCASTVWTPPPAPAWTTCTALSRRPARRALHPS